MSQTRNRILKNLSEGQKGVCISIYIGPGNFGTTRAALENSLAEAKAFLDAILEPEQMEVYLKRLQSISGGAKILRQFKGSIAIFCSKKFFHMMNLPIEVENLTVVANSFHIKPLLKWMQISSQSAVDAVLLEFEEADELGLARRNLFQIAHAAVEGRVKKLILAEDMVIWGKLDRKTGGILLNPFQMDHEDDDVLDDLAEVVISKGGEVLIVPMESMPKARPALAILNARERLLQRHFGPAQGLIGA